MLGSVDSISVEVDQYREVVANPMTIFHATTFNQLVESRTPEIYYLLFRDKKYRAGLIAGVKDNVLVSPFSAPYGGFTFLNALSPAAMADIIVALKQFASREGFRGIRLTPPPLFYDADMLSVLSHSLLAAGFQISVTDLNNQLALHSGRPIEQLFDGDGRRNVRIARDAGVEVKQAVEPEAIPSAYHVIRQNRHERGFPLRMSLQQVQDTLEVVPGDIFLCKSSEQDVSAAAIVYRITSKIAQVVYWGHVERFGKQRPMALLAYEVAKYYQTKGFHYLDIGPSTDRGEVNEGLYRFKHSIGCTASLKFTFEYTC